MKFFFEGFALQASLILALGAQNLFVLESGLKKRRHFLVALICSLCDTILIAVGVAGAGTIFVQVPWLKLVFGILGVLFLAYYGVKKILEAFSKSSESSASVRTSSSLKQVILLTLSFSLLNPHVYLDTIVLIGGYSAKFPGISDRLHFGAGAAAFSTVWFFSLGLFASVLSHLLNNPKSMRVISALAGLILLILSWRLGTDVLAWMV